MKTERNLIELVGEEFLRLVEAGEDPSIADFQSRYSDHAEEIRDFLHAHQVVEKIKPARDSRLDRSSFENTGFPKITDNEIVGEIRRGVIGVVYEAIRIPLNHRVALKLPAQMRWPSFVLRPELQRRFITPMSPPSSISAHVGHHFYAMQYIEGCLLKEVIASVIRIRRGKDCPSFRT